MDDSEPPAKKRTASRQLSKDDGSDSDGDRAQEGGCFKKASDEVLATRRIVKVKRGPATGSHVPVARSPFASIQLVSPPLVSAVVGESRAMNEVSLNQEKSDLHKNEGAVNHETVFANIVKDEKQEDSSKKDLKDGASKAGNGNVLNNDDVKQDPKDAIDVGSCKKESPVKESQSDKECGEGKTGTGGVSSKVAFTSSMRPIGTGFSFGTSPSTFGMPNGFESFRSGWTFGSASTPAFNSTLSSNSGWTFGTASTPAFDSTLSSSLTLSGSGYGALSEQAGFGSTLSSNAEAPSVVSLQEVTVETGEEQDNVVYSADATLFEFVDGTWKERGKGELRVNVFKDDSTKARLLMRSKGNYRLLLNASLFPDMKMTSMDTRGVTFVCRNSVAEGNSALSTYAVKLKDSLSAAAFREAVDSHKGKIQMDLKTPESSPRDSDRDGTAVEG